MLIRLNDKLIYDLKSIRNIGIDDIKRQIYIGVCEGYDSDEECEFIQYRNISGSSLRNAEFIFEKIWTEINKCCHKNENLDLARLIKKYAIYDEPVKYKPARTINLLENDF